MASRQPGLRRAAAAFADRVAVDRVPGRALGALAAVGRRQLGDGDDQRRHVRRRASRRSVRADLERQARRRGAPSPQHHQQHQPVRAGLAGVPLLDGHRLARSRGKSAQDAVDLGRADADAVDVEHAVRAAVHPRGAVGVELDQVAVRPDARVLGEVGVVEAAAVGSPRKPSGRDGNGSRQTSSPTSPSTGVPSSSSLHVEPEAAALASARAGPAGSGCRARSSR